jgi:hypothetical protein
MHIPAPYSFLTMDEGEVEEKIKDKKDCNWYRGSIM